MEAVFIKILNMGITAGWIVLGVVIARFLLKKAPKWISVLLWSIVGIRLICPFSLESIFSLVPSAMTVPTDIVYTDTPMIQSGVTILNSAINPTLSESFSPEPGASVNPMQIVTLIASAVWLIGIAVMLGYLAISYFKIRRRVNEAVFYKDKVYFCDRIASPFILGIIHPKIYLPSNMDEEAYECVIAHENAHLKRCDHLWKPLGFLLLSVYWFNPLLWLAYVLLCRDIEYACDEKVIKQMGIEIKKYYSDALINCSVPRRSVAACPLAFGEVGLKGRIKSVLSYKKPTLWIIIAAIVISAVLAICFLTDPKTEEEDIPKDDITDSILPMDTMGDINYSFELTTINSYDNPYEKMLEAGAGCYALDSVKSLPILKITSRQELENFKQITNDTFDFKASFGKIPAFDDISHKYNDAYFNKNVLLLAYAYAPDTGERFFVECVEKHDWNLTVGISSFSLGYADDAERHYLIAIDIERDKINDVESINAMITSHISPGKDLSPKNVIKRYVLLGSDDPISSAVSLFDNGRFTFTFPAYSSYMGYGRYEEKDGRLILTDEDGKVYCFTLNDGYISFDAEASVKENWTSLINNGARFTEVATGKLTFTFEATTLQPTNGAFEKCVEAGMTASSMNDYYDRKSSAIKIVNKSDFEAFMQKTEGAFKYGDYFDKPAGVPSFDDYSKKYTDEYFKNNTLLLIYAVSFTSSRLSIEYVAKESSSLFIGITEISSEVHPHACGWLIGVDIPKSYNLDDVKNINADIIHNESGAISRRF